MKEVVIVTTWKREELLWLCLEAIRRDDSEIMVCVFTDRGDDSPELRETCDTFHALVSDAISSHNYYGNSFNLLSACDWAVNKRPQPFDIVHLIEDDTIIHPGYLDWARMSLAFKNSAFQIAAVCGRIGSPHIPNWYESPCASWNTEALGIALSHLVPEYFSPERAEMCRVLDEVIFPDSKYKRGGCEQDGFFLRCIEHHGWRTLFPSKPLATHLGFFGYNCPPGRERPTGTIEERIQFCRDLLKDRTRREELFGHGITAREMGIESV